MSNKRFELIDNPLSHSDRIQARIDAFRDDILRGDGDVEYIREILAACHDYMMEFEESEVYMSCFKIKEAIFYIDHFLND